jgi:anti-sigma factor RsiW
MDCKRVDELLGTFCEGMLESGLRVEVEVHLSECARCREARQAMARTIEALHAFERIEPSEDFATRLWQKIDQWEAARGAVWLSALAAFIVRHRRVVATCAMVFVVSLVSGLFVLRQMTTGPAVEMAEEQGMAGRPEAAENFIIRDIPQPVAETADTVYMHFVTGDQPMQPGPEVEDYVFKPAVKPVTARPTF